MTYAQFERPENSLNDNLGTEPVLSILLLLIRSKGWFLSVLNEIFLASFTL